MTHELGHVLALGDLSEEDTQLLTMNPASVVVTAERRAVTLGLGDVLGIRYLYPCDCPLPPISDP